MESIELLTDKNFFTYCAKHYDNPQCLDDEEFKNDLNHIKYIKKLITRYEKSNELKERLILNHIMILNNLFGPNHTTRILYLKMSEKFTHLIPFLIKINILPEKIYNVISPGIIYLDTIPMNDDIELKLRSI